VQRWRWQSRCEWRCVVHSRKSRSQLTKLGSSRFFSMDCKA
jgi:hypothetical protein